MDKDKLLEQIQQLMAENEQLKKQKRYGLVWEEQEEDVEKHLRNNFPMIKESCERKIISESEERAHLLLEGDNLHTLHTLLYTHKDKISLIYADPPYNTGVKDFVYNDKFVDKEDSWKHSKWLSFMAKRLKLAKELLAPDGAIFLSIDDNEMAQLKLLCDEIFGEQNHIVTTVRKTKSMTGDDGTGMNIQHDYLLGYARDKSLIHFVGEEKDYSKFKNPDNDPNGPWVTGDPTAKSGSQSTYFPIENPYTGKVDYPSSDRYWAFSESTMKDYIKSGRITFRKKHPDSQRGFIFKRYKEQMTNDKNPVDSLFFTTNEFLNSNGTSEVRSILGKNGFSYPKPVALIEKLVKMTPRKDAVILDFFAGSGTTGHAVLKVNHEDGGNRQFILCTNNENNICEEVTYERLKRVMNDYGTGNLRYYKTFFVDKKQDYSDARKEVLYGSLDILCIKEDAYEKIEESGYIHAFKGKNKAFSVYFGLDIDYKDMDKITDILGNSGKRDLILYLPDWADISNDAKLLDMVEKGILIRKIPKKIMEIIEGEK